jgi:TonB family protein
MRLTSDAGSAGQYFTPVRRRRTPEYRRVIMLSIVVSVVFHAALVAIMAPVSERMPLVRHIGYRGANRLLPEISVMREPSLSENDVETRSGDLLGGGFRVVAIEVVDEEAPDRRVTDEAEKEPDVSTGDDLLDRLEASLPQPLSSELVVRHLVEPAYPAASIAAGVEGVTTFRLYVSKTGDVKRAWLLSSEVDRSCNTAAYRAVLQWKFEPYLVDGRPTPILVDQRIRFRLRNALRDASGG